MLYNPMRNWKIFGVLMLMTLAVTGCGRKEAPQLTDNDMKPTLSDLSSEVVSGTLTLTFTLHGNAAGGIGYQIDRTELDPYCNCPGFWQRYNEQPAHPDLVGVETTKLLKLRDTTTNWVFRIRAIDQFGNFGPWSHAIHARGIKLQ